MISVMYVDDEPDLLEIGKLFLERSGDLTVATATSVREACALLEDRDYDCAVSDYQMPESDGIEFLKQIRSRHGDLPFILFTGKGREEVAIEALNNGADFYLQKGAHPKALFTELEHKIVHAVSRRRAEAMLHRSERRLTDIIDFLPDATFAIDRDGVVISWNKAMEAMTGVPAGEMLGKGDRKYSVAVYGEERRLLIDLVMHRFEEDDRARYTSIVRDGDSIIGETSFLHPSGRTTALWIKATPFYNEQGEVVGAIESIRDITEMRDAQHALMERNEDLMSANEHLTAAEEELRQQLDEIAAAQQELSVSEQRFRSVYWWTSDMVAFHRLVRDESGNAVDYEIVDCNPTFTEITGISPQQAIGSPASRLYGSVPPPFLKTYERVVASGDAVRFETYYPPLKRHFSISAVPMGDDRFATVTHDISDLKCREEALQEKNNALLDANERLSAAEEELRQQVDEIAAAQQELAESEQRYRGVVEDQTELICRFDPDFGHTFVNEAYCRYFGKKRDELLGCRFVPPIPADEVRRVREHFAALTPERPVAALDHRHCMPDGSERWVRWVDRAFFNDLGQVIDNQSVGRDITEANRYREAIRERYEFERTISTLSSRFVGVTDFDAAVDASLRDIGQFSGASRAYIFLIREREGAIANTHEWCTAGVTPGKEHLQNLLLETFPGWMERLRGGEAIGIADVSALPEEARGEREILESQGIKSLIVLPITVRNRLAGFIGFDNVYETGDFGEDDHLLLRVSADIIGSALDRNRMDKTVRESEARFQFMVDNASDIYLIINPDGTFRYVSPSVEETTGFLPADMKGSIFDAVHPEDAESVRDAWQRMLATPDRQVQVEYRFIRRDGREIFLEARARNYLDEPLIRGVIATVRDVTDRKRAEEGLLEANKKMNLLSTVTRHDIINQIMVVLGTWITQNRRIRIH